MFLEFGKSKHLLKKLKGKKKLSKQKKIVKTKKSEKIENQKLKKRKSKLMDVKF